MSIFSELRRRNVFRVAIAYSVTAWLVAQVAELAFDSFGAPEWVMKTLLFLLAVGFIFAVIFAWAYELTPEGIKLEKNVDRSQSITGQTGRKLNYAIIGVLVVALAFSVSTHRWATSDNDVVEPPEATSEVEETDRSIAVLPFVNMSDDENNEYFSDGLSEELLNVLVKVDGLRVASRTSSFSFKGKDISIPEIASALGVAHVLEGSVRKSGNTIRVTAQLIDVSTDSHLWSETYDRRLEDIFAIQDEISAHIVEELKVALGAGEEIISYSRPTESLEAYETFLRGRHFWSRRGEDNILQAIELFTKATELDPDFARAWSSLAAAHITLPAYSEAPGKVHYAMAHDYANKALSMDPAIAEAHAVMADVLRIDRHWSAAHEHYTSAIELEPTNSTGHLWYAEHLLSVGHAPRALDHLAIALKFDPYNPGVHAVYSSAYTQLGEIEKAIDFAQSADDLGHPFAIFWLAGHEVNAGRFDLARERALASPQIEDLDHPFFDYIDARETTDIETFLQILEQFDPPPQFRIDLLARSGKVDEAIEFAQSLPIRGNAWSLLWEIGITEFFQHPGFAEIIETAGIVEHWDEIGWPDRCSRTDGTILCR